MKTKAMGHALTMRERMLAVVQRQEHDRVPFAMYEIVFPPRQAFDFLGHGKIGIIIASPEVIRATAEAILEAADHSGRLQIQVSENVPLDAWQTSFPIIADAIEAFGVP